MFCLCLEHVRVINVKSLTLHFSQFNKIKTKKFTDYIQTIVCYTLIVYRYGHKLQKTKTVFQLALL